MKKIVLASILILSMVFMSGLSASDTDNNQFTFPDWKNLHKLNTEALASGSHQAWVDIYVNELAKKAYIEKWRLFPVGSIVVKPIYSDQERSETSKLTIMVKMEKGYDSDNADWWYGVYDESGTEVWHQGKIESCIKCHTRAKETDYMFSESVMYTINEWD